MRQAEAPPARSGARARTRHGDGALRRRRRAPRCRGRCHGVARAAPRRAGGERCELGHRQLQGDADRRDGPRRPGGGAGRRLPGRTVPRPRRVALAGDRRAVRACSRPTTPRETSRRWCSGCPSASRSTPSTATAGASRTARWARGPRSPSASRSTSVSASAETAAGWAGDPARVDARAWLMIVGVMLAVVLEILDTSIVNVALPSMMGNLGATVDEISWVVTSYIVANVIVIPMTSWLAGRFGRRRYFVGSIALFTVASFLCGAARSLPELVGFRVVQGLGGGALLAVGQSVLIETFPAERQGTGQAIFGVGAMLGPSLGPTLGGWITDVWSWPWIFWVNLPLGLAAGLLCWSYLPTPRAGHVPAHAGRRLARHRAPRRRHRVAPDPARDRTQARLVRERPRALPRGGVARSARVFRVARAPHGTPGRGPARVPPPRPRRRLHVRRRDGRRALRERVPVPALHATGAALDLVAVGHGNPAVLDRDGSRHADRGPTHLAARPRPDLRGRHRWSSCRRSGR